MGRPALREGEILISPEDIARETTRLACKLKREQGLSDREACQVAARATFRALGRPPASDRASGVGQFSRRYPIRRPERPARAEAWMIRREPERPSRAGQWMGQQPARMPGPYRHPYTVRPAFAISTISPGLTPSWGMGQPEILAKVAELEPIKELRATVSPWLWTFSLASFGLALLNTSRISRMFKASKKRG